MKVVAFLAALVIAYVVVVIASGAGIGVSGGDGRSAEIVLEDLRFAPNRLDAKVGVPLTVRLTNAGTERHDLNFESLHMPGLAGVESILEPGETRTITLRFDTPGVHTFICTLPGHAAAGMTGAAFVRS
jgi:plastocyanin